MKTPALIHRIGQSNLAVNYSDIITLPVDAIVSSDDVKLSMGGGVSRAISEAVGKTVSEEAPRSQPVLLGGVVVTSAAALPQRCVFHAAVLDDTLRLLLRAELHRDLTGADGDRGVRALSRVQVVSVQQGR